MDALYPPIEPYDHGWLAVGDGHEVYYEQCGNPAGKPCLFVHGGPGGGAGKDARRFFDPERYRIVLFDQRGCGRSRPHASLEANTTWDLVADMERLRETLGIERWLVFGGSWGSTLSLAYAQAHTEVVSELVLRGIFLLREQEIRWFYQHGASEMYPDAWEAYLAPIPEAERDDLVQAFHRRLTGPDEAERLAAARAWSVWEASTSFLRPRADFVAQLDAPAAALAMARIECHYFVNGGFF
ncbi:MAG TPA: prolyl aminopeptidase, partial [Halieaceae bacterium]|nr:prolyl aminopeptidase [Halieaceae bacterium]